MDIARKAQILYQRTSSAKDDGQREPYYVPNRMLWPQRGLDPVGQYSHVSIRAKALFDTAISNSRIPFNMKDKIESQLSMFGDRIDDSE